MAGREACLLCHGAQGVRPFPQAHAAFPQTSCLSCHREAAPPVTPAPAPTPGAEPTPTQAPPVDGTPLPTPPPPPRATPTPTASPVPSTGGDRCLTCHAIPGAKLPLPSGEELDLYFDQEAFARSTHSSFLTCADCHPQHTGYPHPTLQATSRRAYTVTQYEVCKRCHFANYTRALDSVHFAMLVKGDARAPTCVECHGAHDVRPVVGAAPGGRPRAAISQTCARCHEAVYETYRASVHGQALVDQDNQDVPVCTDCHGSHRIEDPRVPAFKLTTPELCGRCHGDARLMDRYGLSANVLRSYLQDFHGATVSLYQEAGAKPASVTAVCTDCHGVHDIASTRSPASRVMKTNLVEVCRQCHADANPNFPDAWLSHYDPSPSRAPLVFAVRLFYRILIPFIIGGLVIHILIDLWRWATNR